MQFSHYHAPSPPPSCLYCYLLSDPVICCYQHPQFSSWHPAAISTLSSCCYQHPHFLLSIFLLLPAPTVLSCPVATSTHSSRSPSSCCYQYEQFSPYCPIATTHPPSSCCYQHPQFFPHCPVATSTHTSSNSPSSCCCSSSLFLSCSHTITSTHSSFPVVLLLPAHILTLHLPVAAAAHFILPCSHTITSNHSSL